MDLKPNGSEIMVTNENKREYIEYVHTALSFALARTPCACRGHPLNSLGSFLVWAHRMLNYGMESVTCVMTS